MTAWATVLGMKGSGEVKVVNACSSEQPAVMMRPDTEEFRAKLRALREEVLKTRRVIVGALSQVDRQVAAIDALLTTK